MTEPIIHGGSYTAFDARFRQSIVKALNLPDNVNDITIRIARDGSIQATYTQSLGQITIDRLIDMLKESK
ncbi:hypothetical protein UFOVP124_22 [uncultured Caudovirales phage]|uniref:Uncharacterized protein n=1 Tax=uncultured Caudovirales phage TaxID=2100421 RepID=A0A6J5LG90_9CAUD|nr:hypothetical protein UFOVP124_22 [uncultured Caudovirales phage]